MIYMDILQGKHHISESWINHIIFRCEHIKHIIGDQVPRLTLLDRMERFGAFFSSDLRIAHSIRSQELLRVSQPYDDYLLYNTL